MLACFDDMLTCSEDSFESAFFDDQFTNVADEAALLDVDNFDLDSIFARSTSTEDSARRSVVAAKSSKSTAVVSKLRMKPYRSRCREIDNNAAVRSMQYSKGSNGGKAMLYAFPSFDRSDALLFLPSTLVMHLNCADIHGYKTILMPHLDKKCEIQISVTDGLLLSAQSLFRFHEILFDLHPDSITCVHSTKVVENQIRASVYTKFTDCKMIFDSVTRSVQDPVLQPFFGVERGEFLRRNLRLTEEDSNKFHALSGSDSDLLMYLHLSMVFTIDDSTKKIIKYNVDAELTAMDPVVKVEGNI